MLMLHDYSLKPSKMIISKSGLDMPLFQNNSMASRQ